jgi:lipoyl-dependent peroxiredoxin
MRPPWGSTSFGRLPALENRETTRRFAPQACRVPDDVPRAEVANVIERRATVVWEGDLQGGAGRVTTTSEILVSMPITLASRMEDAQGRTSPEELLAAAHAAAYAMSLSEVLASAGTPADQLEVEATCGLDGNDDGLRIAAVHVSVAATYDGDERALVEAAETARARCPISMALRGNVDVTVDVRVLDEGPVPADGTTDPTAAR